MTPPTEAPSAVRPARAATGDRGLTPGARGGNPWNYAAFPAQAAGDHPEENTHRMHGALSAVAGAYPPYRLAA